MSDDQYCNAYDLLWLKPVVQVYAWIQGFGKEVQLSTVKSEALIFYQPDQDKLLHFVNHCKTAPCTEGCTFNALTYTPYNHLESIIKR